MAPAAKACTAQHQQPQHPCKLTTIIMNALRQIGMQLICQGPTCRAMAAVVCSTGRSGPIEEAIAVIAI